MKRSLLPEMIVDTVTDLTPQFLRERGIRLLMLDFDNTVVPYTTDTPTRRMDDWLRQMSASAVRVCVVSNSRKERVRIFCRRYGIDCITHARKPFSKGIRACMLRYQVPAQACALAGDQIFTDTLGANRAGVRSILVKPINNHTIWLKARHLAEKPFIFLARKRREKL